MQLRPARRARYRDRLLPGHSRQPQEGVRRPHSEGGFLCTTAALHSALSCPG